MHMCSYIALVAQVSPCVSKATDPFHTFSSTFSGLAPSASVCLSRHLSPNFASRFRFVIMTNWKMPTITQRIRIKLLWGFFLHAFWPFLPEGLSLLEPKPFEGLLPSICVCASGAGEDDCACCPRSLPRPKLQESLEHPLAFRQSPSLQRWRPSLCILWFQALKLRPKRLLVKQHWRDLIVLVHHKLRFESGQSHVSNLPSS